MTISASVFLAFRFANFFGATLQAGEISATETADSATQS